MRERVPSPRFSGNRPPSTDFEAVRDGHRAILLSYGPIDLSVARSIAAGTALLVPITGNIFYSDPYIDIATGNVNGGIARVHFQDVANQQSPFLTAQPTSLFKIPFTQLLIENYAQPGKSLLIGYGTDLDLQPGISSQVQATVIAPVSADMLAWDGAAWQNVRADDEGAGIGALRMALFGDAISAAGKSFAFGYGIVGGAAVYSQIQLYNPVGSGVVVYCDQIKLSSAAGTAEAIVAAVAAAAVTDNGTGIPKSFGAGASAAHIRSQNAALPAYSPVDDVTLLAGETVVLPARTPYRLPAGQGLTCFINAVNIGLRVGFEWREKAV